MKATILFSLIICAVLASNSGYCTSSIYKDNTPFPTLIHWRALFRTLIQPLRSMSILALTILVYKEISINVQYSYMARTIQTPSFNVIRVKICFSFISHKLHYRGFNLGKFIAFFICAKVTVTVSMLNSSMEA